MNAKPLSETEADALLAPLARHGQVAVAVSGGPDSLALLALAAAWARRHGRPAPHALTVDHGLREASRAEADLVGQVAAGLGVPHAILTWRHGPVDAGLQARARAARYDLMAAYCAAHGISALVTAHHLDDQAETFLMRLKRGSGLDGLAAIPDEGAWAGLTLLRPLLEIPKDRLVATADAARLPFVRDPSNADPRFERGRLRGSMAALSELGLQPEAIALSARRLRRARAAVEAGVDSFMAQHGERSPAGYASVALPGLLEAPEEIGLRTLARLISTIGGLCEPVRLAKLEAVYRELQADPSKGQTLGRCRIVPSRGRLAVFREVRKAGLPQLALRPGERGLWDNRFRVELDGAARAPVTIRALGEDGIDALTLGGERSLAVPRLAACALPVCRQDDGRLLLPDFGQGPLPFAAPSSRHEGGLECKATFLWEGF